MSRTVTRIREVSSGVDRYGNPVYVDAELDIPGAMFAPEGAGEVVTVGRTIIPSSPTLYWVSEWPDIIESDRVRVDGTVYAVDGVPAPWRDDLGGSVVGGLVVTLKRSAG